MDNRDNRRAFLTMSTAGLVLTACQKGSSAAAASAPNAETKKGEGEDVGAVEDLMREHGVIRRVLIVYRESAIRLRMKTASVPPEALQKAAKLMRAFGEDYHEKQLEEAHIFPAVKKAGGRAAAQVDTLIVQHERGREITEYVVAVTRQGIAAGAAEPLALALETFARMYEEHAAQEDTVVFPAWKKVLSPKQLDEMGDRFEDIEHKTFGKDGFDDAVEKVAAIEKSLGIELTALTAPPPPHL
jgi:hemerythrin-like domain-containing protein